MCSPIGTRCSGGTTCVTGNPLTACVPSATGCTNCHYALLFGSGEMLQDAAGKWEAPADALHGYVVPGFGYVLESAGSSKLQPGDVILTIAAGGEHPEIVNSAWFSLHWESLQLPKDKQPGEYTVTFYRPGEKRLQTLTLTRTP